MQNVLTVFNQWLHGYVPKLLGAAAIVVIGFMIARSIGRLLRKGLLRSRLDPTLHGFLYNAVKIVVQIIVLVTAAGAIGIPTTSFVTLLGGAAVAISLALQNSLSNVASGLLLLFNRPFRVGDYVEVGGSSGTVDAITLMSTALVTPDNKRIIVPNSTLTSQTLVNFSTETFRKVEFSFNISYESDASLAQQLLMRLAQEHPLCLDEPKTLVAIRSLDENGVRIIAHLWCTRAEYWNLLYDYNERVNKTFAENGIRIPYPQVIVHQVPVN